VSAMPRSRAADQRYYGVVTGLVDDVLDPEKQGRVKVTFPWFDSGMVTDWCRVAQFYAGPGHGAFWVPEKDSECVVAFVHGDMRVPIVMGGLHNGKDAPPSARTEDTDEKVIRTRAGHRIVFDDSNGKERILVEDSGGKNSIVLDVTAGQITIKADGGKLLLEASDIEIKAGNTLVLKGTSVAIN
jgi:phage baseplate assembly protein V